MSIRSLIREGKIRYWGISETTEGYNTMSFDVLKGHEAVN